ncbi:MAG TPA: DUF3500 domain-containing protein, partial [Geminicoccaceae bacterium]|nr:DUF3500 domain-containing protein [Geminicoccaceae bacterium]
IESLPPEQRRRAVFPFDHGARFDWHYVPRGDRPGLPVRDMGADQRAAAFALLEFCLSERGHGKAKQIMQLEEVLRAQGERPEVRDPENYAFAVFGDPTDGRAPWAWRVDGHHLSLTFTSVGDRLAVTPHFMGSNPAEVRSAGPLKGLRVLAEETDLAWALLRNLDDAERARAVIADRSMGDIITGPGREDALRGTPAGLPFAAMNEARREAAMRLVGLYAGRLRAPVAEAELARIRDAGIERLHFAWAGPLEPGRPYYYRVHGPTMVIEFDNTQNDANHIHTVWHDLTRGFGADLLRAHYAHGHHHRVTTR